MSTAQPRSAVSVRADRVHVCVGADQDLVFDRPARVTGEDRRERRATDIGDDSRHRILCKRIRIASGDQPRNAPALPPIRAPFEVATSSTWSEGALLVDSVRAIGAIDTMPAFCEISATLVAPSGPNLKISP